MPRLVWLTDLHLDFFDAEAEIVAFLSGIAASDADAVLISGDIGVADSFEQHLQLIERCVRGPIYFVLGNHDFYGGRIAEIRERAAALSRRSQWLRWLPDAGVVDVSARTCLIGHDAWADGRLGIGSRTPLVLNDYYCVQDFQGLPEEEYFARIAELGDEAAAFFRDIVPRAFERRQRLLLVTHVPPFREASWHRGRISDDEGLPHFACKAVGDALATMMDERPECHLTVLCGHTHSPGIAQIRPNLEVRTGQAEYGVLQMQPDVIVE